MQSSSTGRTAQRAMKGNDLNAKPARINLAPEARSAFCDYIIGCARTPQSGIVQHGAKPAGTRASILWSAQLDSQGSDRLFRPHRFPPAVANTRP